MLELHLRYRIHPGRHDDLLAFLRDAIGFYEAPGGISMRLLRDDTDPDRYVEIVEYADRDAYDRDQRRVAEDPTMKSYLDRWHALLAEPAQVETYVVEPDLRPSAGSSG